MTYDIIHSAIRNKQWHKVSPGYAPYSAITWCDEQPSDGRFYFDNEYWWFEYKDDALLFTLRWGTA